MRFLRERRRARRKTQERREEASLHGVPEEAPAESNLVEGLHVAPFESELRARIAADGQVVVRDYRTLAECTADILTMKESGVTVTGWMISNCRIGSLGSVEACGVIWGVCLN